MKRISRLKTRILYQSLIINVITVMVFLSGTLFHLRYGFKQTIDAQLEVLGPSILKQLSNSKQSFNQQLLPMALTFFDDQNPVRILRMETADGHTIFNNPLYTDLITEYIEELKEEAENDHTASHIQTLWEEARTLRVAEYQNANFRVYMAADLAQVDESLWQILAAFTIMFPISVMGSVIASSLLARRVTDPLASLAKQAKQTSALVLNQQISVKNATIEIETLVDILNDMMDRLNRSFLQARRFSSDASHELKTPLTVMHTLLEQKLNQGDAMQMTQDELVQLMKETNRMRIIVEALLVLAKADENSLLMASHPLDLKPILIDLLEDASAIGESKGVTMHSGEINRIIVLGDEGLLRLALYNLIKNAVEHAYPNTAIQMDIICRDSKVSINIFNMGDPIPPEKQERIFERFYRIDSPKSCSSPKGLGLGLNIASEIARAHGGSVQLVESTARGTKFNFSLPRSA